MKIKEKTRYDAELQWYVTNRCNMNCHYCFNANSIAKKFGKIAPINISKLIRTLDKTNKIFKINFLGGEPFLVPNIVEACIILTKKHYISFNTNLTSTEVKKITEKINPARISYITASLHIKELEKCNLINRYIDNFLLCKKKGFNIDAIEVAHPLLLNEVAKYKTFFKERNIDIKFTAFIGKYNGKKYPESYTLKELKIFGIKKNKITIFNQKGKKCNAGYNSGIILPNGNIIRCNQINDKIGNIYKNITFENNLFICSSEFCGCPLKMYNKPLFKKALKETKTSD